MMRSNLCRREKEKYLVAACLTINKSIRKQKKRIWSRQWLLKRQNLGCFNNLMKELALEDTEGYRRFLRMDTETFEYILTKVKPLLEKQKTKFREPIPAAEKLSLTLRFLATGETQSSLAFQFRIAQCTISFILEEVCDALNLVLKENLTIPETSEQWKSVANGFSTIWNFPMCIGAMDGKHIKILPPPGSGSTYYNYKGEFSIVLLALVNSNLEFLYVDIGTNGRISDGGVWNKSKLKVALENNILNVPEAERLPGTSDLVPYVIVADDAFPLCAYIMKPYPGRGLDDQKRIFNYRLSRARRVSENAFGLLASRFRLFQNQIMASPTKAQKYVFTSCCLHNLLRKKQVLASEDVTEEAANNILLPLWRSVTHGTAIAKQIQKKFCDYFNGVGAVPWQNKVFDLH